jgi:hypothetical protein
MHSVSTAGQRHINCHIVTLEGDVSQGRVVLKLPRAVCQTGHSGRRQAIICTEI